MALVAGTIELGFRNRLTLGARNSLTGWYLEDQEGSPAGRALQTPSKRLYHLRRQVVWTKLRNLD